MAVIGICGCEANRNSAGVFDNGGSTVFKDTSPFGVANAAWRSAGGNDMDWNCSNQDTFIQGAFVKMVNTASGFSIWDGATTQVYITTDVTNRKVSVYRGSGTSNLLASSATNSTVPANDWFHLGWKVKIHASAGTLDVWIDGINVISLTGLNTQASANAYGNLVRWHIGQNESGDDYFAFDGSGSSNNSWPGVCRIYTGFPDADTSVQFTPLSGTNFSNVDDPDAHDTDTTYNYSSTAGQVDLFDTSLAVPGGATVLAVEARAIMRKDDVGTRTGRSKVKSGATVVNGSTITFGTTYVSQRQVFDQDPNTSSAWTDTTANALQIGYEIVS